MAQADRPIALSNVRFRGESGHRLGAPQCPLMTQSGHRRLQFAVAQPCGLEATLNKGIAIRAMAKAAQVYVEIACSPKIAVAEAFRVVQHRNDFGARCEVRRLSRPSAQARCDDTSKLWPKRFPEYSALPPALGKDLLDETDV